MSHRTLERIFVRLLFDPALVDAMHADPDAALAGLDLAPHERAQLLAVDRRAWNHDPLRRRRTLRTLVDEFKASTTLLLAGTRSLASLDAFFSGAEFHRTIQDRGSLALAFAEFLGRLVAGTDGSTPAQLGDVLGLETMLARCRRSLRNDPPLAVSGSGEPPAAARAVAPFDAETLLRLAPGHAVGRFDANVVETVNAVERYLFEVGLMPAVALCDDAPRLEALPPLAGEPTYLLALPSSAGVSLMPVDSDYYALLSQFSDGPTTIGKAVASTRAAGVTDEDVAVMLESLVEEGVLGPAQ